MHESLDILTFIVWNSLSLHLRGQVLTKGREIIFLINSQPPFDIHRQYLDVSLMDLQARVSRFFALEFFTALLIS